MSRHETIVKPMMGRLGSGCFGAAIVCSALSGCPGDQAVLIGVLFGLLGIVTAAVMNPGPRLVVGLFVVLCEFASCTAMH